MQAGRPAPDRTIVVPDAGAMERAGHVLGEALLAVVRGPSADGAVVVGLEGSLGAGKTTLARAVLRALGVKGTVRSPTYTIAEPYETRIGRIWHLDLYRIASPDEMECIAIRDLVAESAACLVEWPERGYGAMPGLDCCVILAAAGDGRRLSVEWLTPRGRALGCCVDAVTSGALVEEDRRKT